VSLFVATSLSPDPPAEIPQKQALESWRRLGLRVVSLNFPEEIHKLVPYYSHLAKIIPVEQACVTPWGRRLVALVDLIECSYRMNQGKTALIMNADILLLPAAQTELTQGSRYVTMIPRWQVDRYPVQGAMTLDPFGYDGALLGSEMSGIFRNRSFGLGLPWWDYWIPFRTIHLGYPLKIPKIPLALHVRHKERWNEDDRAQLAGEVWREVGVPPWKRRLLKILGPKKNRKNYGYHNHLAGHIREIIRQKLSDPPDPPKQPFRPNRNRQPFL